MSTSSSRYSLLCLGTALCLGLIAANAFGLSARGSSNSEDNNPALFERATAALQTGAHQDAIDTLELLSDRGFQHPTASYNRALAYLSRASGPNRKSGDLAQAVAGLEEALLLDPSEHTLHTALEHLRKEIAREQARAGNSPLEPRPSISRAITNLCHENTWFILAAVGSALLAVALARRHWAKTAPAQVAALLAGIAGAVLLLCGSAFTHAARQHRLTASPAVVITSTARLLDQAGLPIATPGVGTTQVSEGALVDTLETRGALTRIAWGASDGWLTSTHLRRLTPQ